MVFSLLIYILRSLRDSIIHSFYTGIAQRFLPVLLSRLNGGLCGLTLLLLDCEPLVEPLREQDDRLPLPAAATPAAAAVAAVLVPAVLPFSELLCKVSEDFDVETCRCWSAIVADLSTTCCSTLAELLRMAAAAASIAPGVGGVSMW